MNTGRSIPDAARDLFALHVGRDKPVSVAELRALAGAKDVQPLYRYMSGLDNGALVAAMHLCRERPEAMAFFAAQCGHVATPLSPEQGHGCERKITADAAALVAYSTHASVDGYDRRERMTMRQKVRKLIASLGLYEAFHARKAA